MITTQKRIKRDVEKLAKKILKKKMRFYSAVEMLERRLIELAIEKADGSFLRAAQLVGLERTTLVEIRRRLGFKIRTRRKTTKKRTTPTQPADSFSAGGDEAGCFGRTVNAHRAWFDPKAPSQFPPQSSAHE